jgi:hypothetical protein
MSTPEQKRVVLLSKSATPNEKIVKAFLRHSLLPENEYEQNLHFFHLYPDRTADKWSHIVVDMNSS